MKRLLIRLIIAISFVGIVMLSQYIYVHHVKENPSDPGEEISYVTYTVRSSPALPDESQNNEPSPETGIPEAAERVEVVWVSDGDTYIVNRNGEEVTIRLIGVDTPESVASEEYQEKSGKHNTTEGKAASEAMKATLPKGTYIYILPGKEDTDMYGRTLVYAWFEDGKMIEDFLLENGYAKILEIPPNTEYSQHFREVEKAA